MIKVKIQYYQKARLLLCNENTKCISLLRKYALIESIKYEDVFFLADGGSISANDIKRLKLKEIFIKNNEEKYKDVHQIIVNDNDFGRTASFISTASMAIDEFKEQIYNFKGSEKEFDDMNDLNDVADLNDLIEEFSNIQILTENGKSLNDEENKNLNNKINNEVNLAIKSKYFSIIKSYSIPIFQFILISFLFGIFSSKDLIKDFKNCSDTISKIFIIFMITIIFGLSISLIFIPIHYLTKKLLIISIFFVINTLCILFGSFLLAKYIDYKHILSCFILEVLINLSVGIYIVIKYLKDYKKLIDFSFNKYAFLLFPFISNLLTIIALYFAMIENIYKIINISIISLILIIAHFFIAYSRFKNYNSKEYILTSFCISLTIFYFIVMEINKCYKYINSHLIQYHGVDVKVYIIKMYSIILIEFTSIGIIVFLGYYYNLNEFFSDNAIYFLPPCIAILITIYILKFFISKEGILYATIILFIPILIIFLFLISYLIKDKNIILCCFSLIYLDIVSMEIYAIFCKLYDPLGMIISPIIINIISLPLFYLFWIKEVNNIICISTFALIILIFNYFIFKKLLIFINADFRKVLSYVIYINLSILYSIDMIFVTLKEKIKENNNNNPKSTLSLKINSVLLLYLIIFIIGNKIFPRDKKFSDLFVALTVNFLTLSGGLLTIYVLYNCFSRDEEERNRAMPIFFIFNIFYIVFGLFLIPVFSYEQVLLTLLILLFDIVTMEFYSLFTNSFSYYLFAICPYFSHGISTLIIHFSYQIDHYLLISGITLGILVYIMIIELILLNKVEIYVDEGCYSISLINYIKCSPLALYCEILITPLYFIYYKPFQLCFCPEFHCQCCDGCYDPYELCWCEGKCPCDV